MVHTEEQIAQMTAFEVNRETAIKLFGESNVKVVHHRHEHDVLVLESKMEHVGFIGFDPTSNWRDVMPIAEKHGISLNFRLGQKLNPLAIFDDQSLSANQNPKRAICEVFLMMDFKND